MTALLDPGAALERRLATVVAADVVGFSRLVARSEQEVFQRLFAIRRDIIDPAIKSEGGRVIKTMGDGMLVEFATRSAALRAARVVQIGVAAHEGAVAPTDRIRFRIGINHGSVMIDGDDLLGDVVNIAARLESLAPAGGICVSRPVRDLIDPLPEAEIAELGLQFVRNIPNPVEVWQIRSGVDAGAPNLQRRHQNRPSVLVLPFEQFSDQGDDHFLADGLTDGVTTALARFRSLFVIARGSSFIYKGRDRDIGQIARDTGVRCIVKGSLRRAGAHLRVQAQPIEAEGSAVIWSQKYDRDIENIFDVQDEITQSVVTGLAGACACGADFFRPLHRPAQRHRPGHAIRRPRD